MTIKKFKSLKFENIGFIFSETIGRVWDRKLKISVVSPCKIGDKTYTDFQIIVEGKPRYGEYLIFSCFEYSKNGFNEAKKFALKANNK